MSNDDRIMRIPKVIWERNLWPIILESVNECKSKLQTVNNFLSGRGRNIDQSDEILIKMQSEISTTRRKLNFIDQNLEVLSDLIQYLLERDERENDDG